MTLSRLASKSAIHNIGKKKSKGETTEMKKLLASCALAVALTTLGFAHGNAKHVMGTVESVAAQSITVKTTAKTTETITLSPQTKFIRSGAAAKAADLKKGERVVVEVETVNGRLQAESVRFGKAGAKAMPMKHDMSGMKDMSRMSH